MAKKTPAPHPAAEPVAKLPSGIPGLDEVLEGGLPAGRATLLSGSTGTGKSVFLAAFLVEGERRFDEAGVFVTFEERPADIVRNMAGFGWDLQALADRGRLAFVDGSPVDFQLDPEGGYDLTPILARIEHAIGRVGAKRLAIDAVNALFARFPRKDLIRSTLNALSLRLKELGVTTLIAGERQPGSDDPDRFGVLEFASDGVLELDLEKGQQQTTRRFSVRKLRGCGYRSGAIEYVIDAGGVRLFPKIRAEVLVAKTDFTVRSRFGILALDRMLGGGIPQGHSVLLTGNTGTGKTTFGMQFLVEGFRAGESAVFVALEESLSQVRKTALQHGWDLQAHEAAGRLAFVSASLIDLSSDRLLADIVAAVERTGARRLVFDSVSSLMSATMTEEEVRQFLIQLSAYLKSLGVTSVLNYLTGSNFGAVKGQLLSNIMTNEMRLSSTVDGMILLLFVERGQTVRKLINVLKLRGSAHSKEVYRFEIRKGRIVFQGKYEE